MIIFLLIDFGSTLNICNISLTHKINFDTSPVQHNSFFICGFDNVYRKPLGTMKEPIMIQLVTLPTPIHVKANTLTYNLLLGNIWIHTTQKFPCALHCTKIMNDN